jgi:hypothetical protein
MHELCDDRHTPNIRLCSCSIILDANITIFYHMNNIFTRARSHLARRSNLTYRNLFPTKEMIFLVNLDQGSNGTHSQTSTVGASDKPPC